MAASNDSPALPVDATIEQMLAAAGVVRAGRVLTPTTWKDGARVAVCITIDVDNEFPLALGHSRPCALSLGEYGALAGLPRLLRSFARHDVPCSFFIPAGSLALHPGMADAIMESGRHEIGVHGWTHEFLPSLRDPDQEHELLVRAIDHLTAASGVRPVGFRAPAWEFGQQTMELLRREGFDYDSSMMARDEPYELLSHGSPTGLIEIPVHWAIDDAPYFGYAAPGVLPDPEVVFRVFRDEFDAASEEGGLFVLTLHSMISGLRGRVAALDRLLAHIRGSSSVWFATTGDVAAHVRAESGLPAVPPR